MVNLLESDEPLHLCISSKFYDTYKMASHLVQELIMTVYEEYRKYCEKSNRTFTPLNIKYDEGVSMNVNSAK